MLVIPFLFLLVPLLIWGFSPLWARPWIAAALVVIIVAYLVWFVRSLLRARAAERARPGRGDWHWAPGATSLEYATRLGIHLSTTGWRVISAHVPDADGVLLELRQDETHIGLLCRRPGVAIQPDDAARLADTGCPQQLTITDTAPPDATHRGYPALEDLTQALALPQR